MREPPTTVLSPHVPAPGASGPNGTAGGPKPKVKKLRLAADPRRAAALLAVVSTVFGMMMAVASDLPELENKAEFKAAENSMVFAAHPRARRPEQLAKLTGNQNRILVGRDDISPNIKNAVIAIEDRASTSTRAWTTRASAARSSRTSSSSRAAQGGSTITQQFVKNALAAQGDRSVFQKLREAALAYHLERKWTKQKVLTQYLNSVYFGNGAYGVEAAVRTYFGEPTTRIDTRPRRLDPGGGPTARTPTTTSTPRRHRRSRPPRPRCWPG